MSTVASLSTMKIQTTPRGQAASDRPALWLALLAGLILMAIAAAARSEVGGFQARRTENFTATLASGATLKVENVSGDIVAKPGRAFAAVVTIVVTAPTQKEAEELLSATRVTQSREGDDVSLETHWPGSDERHVRGSRSWVTRQIHPLPCRQCRITAQYELTVPPGIRTALNNVNGDVRADDLDADLSLQTVNGAVSVRGARRSVTAHSVNGKVNLVSRSLPPAARIDLKTVNGAVLATLPREAKFQLSASSMNGVIASTFALPPRAETDADEVIAPRPVVAPNPPRTPRAPRRIVIEKDGDEDDVVVDLKELEKELEESMREVDVEVQRNVRGVDRQVRRMRILPGGDYTGSIGQGGAAVHASTLNGSITVLASGTVENEAKVLVSPRRSFSVEVPRVPMPHVEVRIPRIEVRAPRAIIPRTLVRVESGLPGAEDEVVRGDVAGDFLATSGSGSYRIGNVTGRVKVLTQAGEIHVGSIGAGAELKTYGGDITIGPVHGDLKALTMAGDVHAGAVTGSATVDTSGGDVRIERIGGAADVRTGGGDIVLPAVAGAVEAHSSGGDVRVDLVSRDPRGPIVIHNGGGDVTLTLPRDMRADVELDVTDCGDPGDSFIRSDFPEISVLRRSDSAHASGALNGGGTRVLVRTSSGTIRIRKGPASQ